jgi:hypothetical protein
MEMVLSYMILWEKKRRLEISQSYYRSHTWTKETEEEPTLWQKLSETITNI